MADASSSEGNYFLCPREHAEKAHIHIHRVSNGTITAFGIAAPTRGIAFSRLPEAQNRERRSQTLRQCNPVLPRLRHVLRPASPHPMDFAAERPVD